MEKPTQFNVAYLVFALLAILLLQQWWTQAQQTEVVPYSEFEKLLAQNRIEEGLVSDQRIVGKLKTPEGGKTVAVANLVQPDLAERLSKFVRQVHAGRKRHPARHLLGGLPYPELQRGLRPADDGLRDAHGELHYLCRLVRFARRQRVCDRFVQPGPDADG